jgi:hypothetical protein
VGLIGWNEDERMTDERHSPGRRSGSAGPAGEAASLTILGIEDPALRRVALGWDQRSQRARHEAGHAAARSTSRTP